VFSAVPLHVWLVFFLCSVPFSAFVCLLFSVVLYVAPSVFCLFFVLIPSRTHSLHLTVHLICLGAYVAVAVAKQR